MSTEYQGHQIRKEEKQFLLELEKIVEKPIPHEGEFFDTHLDGYDRYGLPREILDMQFTEKDGTLTKLIIPQALSMPDSIKNLNTLEYLKVSIFPESITMLKSLKTLDLRGSSNSVRELPENVGDLESLEELYLECYFLKKFPESFGNLKSMKHLHILGLNYLTSFPKGICNLKSLETLNLLGNSNCTYNPEYNDMRTIPIRTLPPCIGNLNSLKILNLRGCKMLESIPEEIGNLRSLEVLILGEYDWDFIDPDFVSIFDSYINLIRYIQPLRITNRKASKLPESIGNLKALKIMDLSFWKNLETLPESIGQLESLEELNLQFCASLSSLPENIGNLKSLRSLNLLGCKSLESFPESMKYLKSLESIDIRGCNFKEIPSALIHLDTITSIDLLNNPLDIEENKLSTKIEPKIIDTLPLTPENVYKEYIDEIKTKEQVFNNLTNLIINSNSPFVITRCLELLDKLDFINDNLLNILEEQIRLKSKARHMDLYIAIVAFEILIRKFPNECLEILKETIINTESIIIIETIYKLLPTLKNEISDFLNQEILRKYARIYKVHIEEAQFFLDLEIMCNKEENQYCTEDFLELHGSVGDLRRIGTDSVWNVRNNIYYGEGRNGGYAVINQHVKALNFNVFSHYWKLSEIPESINSLSRLRYLRASGKYKLPESFELTHKLAIKGKILTETPDIIFSNIKKKYLRKHLRNGVSQLEAPILIMLEFLCDTEIRLIDKKTENFNYRDSYQHGYIIGKNGMITGLFLTSDRIKVFPKKIISLEHLEVLSISSYSNINKFPEEIFTLKNLKHLNLMGNNIENIPSSINNCKNLISVYMDYEKIPISQLIQIDMNLIDHPNILTTIGREISKSNHHKAIEYYKKDLEKKPRGFMTLTYLGYSLIALGKDDEAIKVLKESVEIAHWNHRGWYSLGDLYGKKGDIDNAINALTQALKEVKFPRYKFKLGLYYGRKGNYKKAIELMEQALERRPENFEYLISIAFAYDHTGQYEKSIEMYKRLSQIESQKTPKKSTFLTSVGYIYVKIGNYEKAIEEYTNILKNEPKNISAIIGIGEVFELQNDFENAFEQYNKALEINPQIPFPVIRMALFYAKIGKFDNAVDYCERALQIDPKNFVTWNTYGKIYETVNDYDKAIEKYNKALEFELDPIKYGTLCNLGIVYLKKGDFNKAIESCLRALELSPNNFSVLNTLSFIYEMNGENDKAIEQCIKVLDINPNEHRAWNNLSYAYIQKMELSKALEAAEKAIEINPKYANPWNHKGFVLFKRSEREKGIELIMKSIELNPKYGRAWYNLALIYYESKQYDQALENCEKCLELESWYKEANILKEKINKKKLI